MCLEWLGAGRDVEICAHACAYIDTRTQLTRPFSHARTIAHTHTHTHTHTQVTKLKIAEILSDVAHVQLRAPVCATVRPRVCVCECVCVCGCSRARGRGGHAA